jgi:hypothetical protein
VRSSLELSLCESVQLFVERACAVQPEFPPSDDALTAVAEICRRLDGLPLAIELAAARTRMLDPEAMLARLESRLQLLTGGARDAPARQQTLQRTIGWSYGPARAPGTGVVSATGCLRGGCTLGPTRVWIGPRRLELEEHRRAVSAERPAWRTGSLASTYGDCSKEESVRGMAVGNG